MKFFSLFFVCISLNLFAQTNMSVNVNLSPSGSFQATTTKIKGQLKQNGALIEGDKISVLIETLKTGIDLRDEHFAKHLHADKYPKATLTQLKAQGGKGTANLEVNGVVKPITINYVLKDGVIKANFSLKASDFNLSKAQYLGVGVEDLVTVTVDMPVK
jgi:polyisoprenoid-binding protein YceI